MNTKHQYMYIYKILIAYWSKYKVVLTFQVGIIILWNNKTHQKPFGTSGDVGLYTFLMYIIFSVIWKQLCRLQNNPVGPIVYWRRGKRLFSHTWRKLIFFPPAKRGGGVIHFLATLCVAYLKSSALFHGNNNDHLFALRTYFLTNDTCY